MDVELTRVSQAADALAEYTNTTLSDCESAIQTALKREDNTRRVLFVDHPMYPKAVQESGVGPLPLEVCGVPHPLDVRLAAILGDSSESEHWTFAYQVGKKFSSEGFPIVSILDGGIGSSVLEATAMNYSRAVAICPDGIDAALETFPLVTEQLLKSGGMLVALPVAHDHSCLMGLTVSFAADVVGVHGFFSNHNGLSAAAPVVGQPHRRLYVAAAEAEEHEWVRQTADQQQNVRLFEHPATMQIGGEISEPSEEETPALT